MSLMLAVTTRRLLLLSLLSTVALADEATLVPVADTVIYEDAPTFSSGAGAFLFVGPIASGSPRRSLLRFDLSVIPQGATVTASSVSVGVSLAARRADFADQLQVHRLTAGWAEGTSDGGTGGQGAPASEADATWTARHFNSPPGTPSLIWTQPGGDFVAAPSATTPLTLTGQRSTFASNPALVADVQGWLDAPASNHGWILIGQEDRDQSVRRLHGRTLADGPRLVVTYEIAEPVEVPALPLAACLLLAAAMAVSGRRRTLSGL